MIPIYGCSPNGVSPQPDKAWRGRLWFWRRLAQGLAVRVADRHHSLRR